MFERRGHRRSTAQKRRHSRTRQDCRLPSQAIGKKRRGARSAPNGWSENYTFNINSLNEFTTLARLLLWMNDLCAVLRAPSIAANANLDRRLHRAERRPAGSGCREPGRRGDGGRDIALRRHARKPSRDAARFNAGDFRRWLGVTARLSPDDSANFDWRAGGDGRRWRRRRLASLSPIDAGRGFRAADGQHAPATGSADRVQHRQYIAYADLGRLFPGSQPRQSLSSRSHLSGRRLGRSR